MKPSASLRFFTVALGLGLLLRLAIVLLVWNDPSTLAHSDQRAYILMAQAFMDQGFGPGLSAERVPGYGLFLALCAYLAPGGEAITEAVGTHALLLAVLLQNLAGLTAIHTLYRTGALFNQTTANLAGGFAALNLNVALYSSQILTDALFYPLFALLLYFFLRYHVTRAPRDLLLTATLLGLATMIRSVTMYLPLFVAGYLFVELCRDGFWARLRRVALVVVVFAALMAPWLARNYVVHGHAAMTTQGRAHLVGWVMPAIAQYEESLDLGAAMRKYSGQWSEHVRTLPREVRVDPFAVDAEAKSWFLDYLRTVSPASVAKAWFWGAMKNLFAPVSIELAYILRMEWSHFHEAPGASFPEQAWNFVAHNANPVYSLLLVGGIALTLLLRVVQLAGAWRLVRARPGMALGGLMVVGYFLAVNGPVGYAKYRLPLEPLFVLLTALAVGLLPALRREAEQGGAAGAGLRAVAGPALRVTLAGGCLLYAVWGIDPAALGRSLGALPLAGMALCAVVLAVDLVAVGLRLRVISGGRVGLGAAVGAGCVGIGLNNILPAKLGEAAKALYLARAGRAGAARGLGWVFWERFGDLNMLLLAALGAVALVGGGGLAWPLAALVLGLWAALAALARWPRLAALAERLMPLAGLKRLVHELAGHLGGDLRGAFLGRVALFSLITWAVYYLQYVVLLRLTGGLDLDAGQMLAVFVMAAGGLALPSTPGGLGVYEAVMVAALAVFGVPREQALALGVFYHVLLFVPTTALALALLLRSGLGLGALRAGAGATEASHA